MKCLTACQGAVFAIVMSVAFSTVANADGAPDFSTCQRLDHQVTAALKSAASDVPEARAERQKGLEFCRGGFYEAGVSHYQTALSLLGQK